MRKTDLYYKLELSTAEGYKAILVNENSKITANHEHVKVKDLKVGDVILNNCLVEKILKTGFPFELDCKKTQYIDLPSFLNVIEKLNQQYPDDYWDLNSDFSRKLLQDNMILEVDKMYLGVVLTDCFCIDYYSSGDLCKGHYVNEKDIDLSFDILKKHDLF